MPKGYTSVEKCSDKIALRPAKVDVIYMRIKNGIHRKWYTNRKKISWRWNTKCIMCSLATATIAYVVSINKKMSKCRTTFSWRSGSNWPTFRKNAENKKCIIFYLVSVSYVCKSYLGIQRMNLEKSRNPHETLKFPSFSLCAQTGNSDWITPLYNLYTNVYPKFQLLIFFQFSHRF